MKTTKILALCLLTLVLIAVLASCGGKNVPKDTEEPSVTEAPALTEAPAVTEAPNIVEKLISKESLAEYTVIAPMTTGYL